MAMTNLDKRVEALAQQVAEKTGEDLTQAVVHSLEERLQRLKGKPAKGSDLVQRIMEIGARCSALPDLDDRCPDEILGYDENGAFG